MQIKKQRRKYCKDANGNMVFAGDRIRFSYGIPARLVIAEVVEIGGFLVALTPQDHPRQCRLVALKSIIGEWYLEKP